MVLGLWFRVLSGSDLYLDFGIFNLGCRVQSRAGVWGKEIRPDFSGLDCQCTDYERRACGRDFIGWVLPPLCNSWIIYIYMYICYLYIRI